MSVDFSAIDKTRSRPGQYPDAGFPVETGEELNLANVTAIALAGLLRIDLGGVLGLCGEITIPEARRAVMVARATFARTAPQHAVAASSGRGTRGARYHDVGVDEERLRDRLEAFARLVEAAASAGATHIVWS